MESCSTIYDKIVGMDICIDNNTIWLSFLDKNGFCEIDKETKECKKIVSFENQAVYKEGLYTGIVKVSNKIINIPYTANKIAIYDLRKHKMSYIELCNIDNGSKTYYGNLVKFDGYFTYEEDVYLLGLYYAAIVKINVKTLKVTYITEWVDKIEKQVKEWDGREYFSDGVVFEGTKALIPCKCCNVLLELDLKTLKSKSIVVNAALNGIDGILSDGKHIWIVGSDGYKNKLICWDKRDNSVIEEFFISSTVEGIVTKSFYAPIYSNFKIYLIPLWEPHVYEFDLKNKKMCINKDFEKVLNSRKNISYSYGNITKPQLIDNKIYFITTHDFMWHEYDLKERRMVNYFVTLPENSNILEVYFESLFQSMKSENIIVEERQMPLSIFVQQMKSCMLENAKKGASYGKLIYEQCTENIKND